MNVGLPDNGHLGPLVAHHNVEAEVLKEPEVTEEREAEAEGSQGVDYPRLHSVNESTLNGAGRLNTRLRQKLVRCATPPNANRAVAAPYQGLVVYAPSLSFLWTAT